MPMRIGGVVIWYARIVCARYMHDGSVDSTPTFWNDYKRGVAMVVRFCLVDDGRMGGWKCLDFLATWESKRE